MKEQIITSHLTPADASDVIDGLLNYLKEYCSLTGKQVETDTGLSGLSKARNFGTYQQRKVGGLKLSEILESIANHYQVNISRDRIEKKIHYNSPLVSDLSGKNTYSHFFYYYFSHWNKTVNYAVITFLNNFSKAQLSFYDIDGSPIFQSGKGRVWRTGSTLFAQLPNSRPDHVSLICLYVGNNRQLEEFEWIAGTYSSTRLRDEAPVCGLVLLHKIGNSQHDLPDITGKTHVIPKLVKQLLTDKRLGVLPTVVFNEADLLKIIDPEI